MAVPTPLTVTLDLPGGLHKTVHVDLLDRAAEDPLPSQHLTDSRPGPVLIPEENDPDLNEYTVEKILRIKNARGRNKKQVLVQWAGHLQPTWEPLENLQDTAAWEEFQSRSKKG